MGLLRQHVGEYGAATAHAHQRAAGRLSQTTRVVQVFEQDARWAAFVLLGGRFCGSLAEGVGFEPTETRNASPVFKTGAIGH